MGWTADFDYTAMAPQVSATPPPVGSTQVCRVMKADYQEETKSGGFFPRISLFGKWPEFDEDATWNGTIFLPNPEDRAANPEKFEKSARQFAKEMGAFGVNVTRGMGAEQIAAALVGRCAQAKVSEDDYGLKGQWFKPLKPDQAERFPQPGATATGSGQRSTAPHQPQRPTAPGSLGGRSSAAPAQHGAQQPPRFGQAGGAGQGAAGPLGRRQ